MSLLQIGMLWVNFQLSSKIVQFYQVGSHSVAGNILLSQELPKMSRNILKCCNHVTLGSWTRTLMCQWHPVSI